jgi:hypothetical protein
MKFMSKAWTKLDLEGGGLQTLNLRLVRELRKRRLAYFLWLFFPLGAHAFYLRDRPRALVYVILSVVALSAFLLGYPRLSVVALVPLVALALYDLAWIERRLVAVNKHIRMGVYLKQTTGAPPGFQGRYTDEDDMREYVKEKEQEQAGHISKRASTRPSPSNKKTASFAQQEALLRELARRSKEKP